MPMQNDIVLFLAICNQSMCPIPFTKLECACSITYKDVCKEKKVISSFYIL